MLVKVSLAFARLPDAELVVFGQNVVDSIDQPVFSGPPVPHDALSDMVNTFVAKLAAAEGGGLMETAQKNAARDALVDGLRQDAIFIQGKCNGDLATLLSSGYQNINTNRTQAPLPAPIIANIGNEMSTQLALRLQPVQNARAYEVQYKNGTGGFQMAGVYTQARKIVVSNLTPGSVYTVQARAIGGTTGYSDWSDPVSHMAT